MPYYFRIAGLGIDLTEKAASITFMTRCATQLLYLHQQRVGVAVVEDLFEMLDIATLFALAPEPASTAAKIDDAAGA